MKKAVKKENILELVRSSLEKGTLRITMHALDRMKERNLSWSDLKDVIVNGRREFKKDLYNIEAGEWKYAIRGFNEEKEKDIRVIVVLGDFKILVITMIELKD